MTSRAQSTLGTILLTATLGLASACGGTDDKDAGPSADRGPVVAITAQGVAAVVDRHLGDQVKRYAILSDESEGKLAERTIEVKLRGADPRDSFTVSVYPENGSRGQVVKGSCDEAGTQDDPQAKVTCTPAPDGGNVTITHFAFGLSGGKKGGYLIASATGPDEREVTAAYDGFTRKVPVSDKDLQALLADPDLAWETDPATNKAGKSLKVVPAD